jgi:uncharacterized membrane protein
MSFSSHLSGRHKTAIFVLVVAIVAYLLSIGSFAIPAMISLRGLLTVLAFYLAYRLVRAIERIAIGTEQLSER